MQTPYRGGMIFDDTGELVRDHGLLVEGGTIARVAPSSEFVGFSGHVVDTSGGTLIPGLVDCHVQLTLGGLIAMGTDAGTPFNKHGEYAAELANMVDIEMSARDTIIAATRNGAELMGLADSGVLSAGKAADMVLVCGNPLENIAMVADRAIHRAAIRNGAIVHQRPAVQVAVAAE